MRRTGRRSDLMHFRCTRLWMLLELSVTDGGAHQPEFIPMASRGMTLFAPTCGSEQRTASVSGAGAWNRRPDLPGPSFGTEHCSGPFDRSA
ncbi:unnamed protein product [Prorocentrum cordatum]|uniref:Uncharacterized protein n=1 Tax=Prorocentrum cordatum TaxID=2364126 RepID=A0ABN9TGI4_9DINO|nr:unnamed protein product [Polarella glacialis]